MYVCVGGGREGGMGMLGVTGGSFAPRPSLPLVHVMGVHGLGMRVAWE